MLGGRWLRLYPAGHEKSGLVTRMFQCELCKAETEGDDEKITALPWYQQHVMSKDWLKSLPAGGARQILEDNPQLLVPEYCPRHERGKLKDLIIRQGTARGGPYGYTTPSGYFTRDGSEGANSDAWQYGAKD